MTARNSIFTSSTPVRHFGKQNLDHIKISNKVNASISKGYSNSNTIIGRPNFSTLQNRSHFNNRSSIIMQATNSQVVKDIKKSKDLYDGDEFKIYRGEECRLMGAADNLQPMAPYPLILTEGGDCRLPLDPTTGTNKYHCKPEVHASTTAFRGSCTCNSPTQLAFDASQKAYEQLMASETNCDVLM